MSPIVEIDNISKCFGSTRVLEGVSFTVRAAQPAVSLPSSKGAADRISRTRAARRGSPGAGQVSS